MELIEIISLAAKDYTCTKNRENWETFASEHQLPNYEEIKELFNGWKEFKQEVYIFIGKEHVDNFYTPKFWDPYALENHLPESKHYRGLFGDWKQALTLVHKGLNAKEVKRKFLLSIATKYKENLMNQKDWDTFATDNDLPISATYKNHFGSWSNLIKLVTGERPVEKRYTKEYLLKIMKENKDYLVTQETWKKFAQENQLPSVNALVKHFGSFNKAKKHVAINKIQKREFSKEELLNVAQEHKDVFHLSLWNFYASTNRLPTETAYLNNFGQFKEVQKQLGIVDGEYTDKTQDLMSKAIQKKQDTLNKLIKENGELIEQIYKYWSLLDSKTTWDIHAEEYGYPKYLELLSIFITKRELKQTLYYYIALQNKTKFNNKEWNEFAKENDFPHKMNYYNLFSSWDLIQSMIWGDSKQSKKDYLLRIAQEHIEQITTYNNWKKYASKHNLPSASQFEFHFGSWNELKKVLGLRINRQS